MSELGQHRTHALQLTHSFPLSSPAAYRVIFITFKNASVR